MEETVSKVIELFENQRYSMGLFHASGWGSSNLLPTDRNAFSTSDGVSSWTSPSEAEKDLLSMGWESELGSGWEFQSTVDALESATLDESTAGSAEVGWLYAADFTKFADPEATSLQQRNLDFVRRRRLTRIAIFRPELLCKGASSFLDLCDHCDSAMIDRIKKVILESLAEVALVNDVSLNDVPGMTKLKNRLILELNLQSVELEENLPSISRVIKTLKEFPQKTKSNWGNIFGPSNTDVADRMGEKAFSIYKAQICTDGELTSIASVVVRKFDNDFEFHCNKSRCGDKCVWYAVHCPHIGCDVKVSRAHARRHDDVCPHKVLECERKCGDSMPRRLLPHHLDSVCGNREVSCPFLELGCQKELQHKEVPGHLDGAMDSHLYLAMNRLLECQKVIATLNSKVNQQDETIEELHASNAKLKDFVSKKFSEVDARLKKHGQFLSR
jgi:hypothetical protein